MTATSHAIIGTLIAAKVGNPALAVPLALASHVLADLFPHWDTGTNRRKKTHKMIFMQTFFDVLLGFALSYLMIIFLFPTTNLLYAFAIILVAQSPDWLMAPYYFFKMKAFKWVYDAQKKFDNCMDKPWGIIGQVAIIILCVIVIKNI